MVNPIFQNHLPFRSFIMGGYECADHINRAGDRINLLSETGHDKKVREDYALLIDTGIKTVREGICWSSVEIVPFVYDFSEVLNRIEAAAEYGIQQVWDMCHFGYPDDLIPTHPKFALRFASLCKAFAEFYNAVTDETLVVCPINEISFLSWHSGDMRGTVPFAVNMGWDIKYHLCKAAIKGIEALKAADPNCRILLVEPLIKIHALETELDLQHVQRMNDDQFQAMDIIAGRICPELGGKEENLDLLGFNYYYNNQWEHNGERYEWPWHKHKSTTLSALLLMAYQRYHKPIVLTETGHFGEGRAQWMNEVTQDCLDAIRLGVDLRGMCLYPLIDRPDWDNMLDYHRCGIWDVFDSTTKQRHVCAEYMEAVQYCQQLIQHRPMIEMATTAHIAA